MTLIGIRIKLEFMELMKFLVSIFQYHIKLWPIWLHISVVLYPALDTDRNPDPARVYGINEISRLKSSISYKAMDNSFIFLV